jgi:hypothetical protein
MNLCVSVGVFPMSTQNFITALMDDKHEGRPSFRTSNEVRDVIDGDRQLTVGEVADKCVISRTTVHEILVQELHMNRICARWVPRMLSEENMTNRTPLENLLCHLNTNERLTLECVTDRLMNLCVSVGVFPMSTQNFITALCSTLFESFFFKV